MQRRPQGQHLIVEVKPVVVQMAAAQSVVCALPQSHVGAGLDTQHERKVFGTHAGLQIAHHVGGTHQAAGHITGKGGHGAHPYQTVDPVLVAGHIITAVQSIVSRNVKPVDSVVISLCGMQAGDLGAMSVIAGSAKLVGTVRTFKTEVQALIERRLGELCSAIAQGFGATAVVTYERMYPATINTAAEAQFAGDVAQSLVGAANVVRDLEPSMGAEDFSFMLRVKPGAYLRLGQGAENGLGSCHLHNNRYDFNDDVLPLGAALHASLAERFMPLGEA